MSHCDNLCCTKINNLSVGKIIENINLHVHCGEITALIGPNGAGKSTLIKSIIGEKKYSGTIEFTAESGAKKKPVIGYVPQNSSFDHDSPATVGDLFSLLKNTKKDDALKILSVVKAEELFERKLAKLSGGELQRVLLGFALTPVPNLLLLDEPVSGVDEIGIQMFWGLLEELKNKYDMTIIIVSHNLSQVNKYADRVVLMEKTIIKSGKPDEIFNSEEFNRIFGII